MTSLTIPVELAERLEAYARREQRTVEALLEDWLREHERPTPPATTAAPTDQAAILRQDRLHTYDRVRTYWREAGDPDGVPRLRSEMMSIRIPSDPLKLMLEASKRNTAVLDPDLDRDDISENFDEVLNDLIRRDLRNREAERNGE